MRLAALLAPFLLASCAHGLVREAPPVTSIVHQQCVAAADVPPIPERRMPATGTVDQLAAGISADVLSLDAYARSADAILKQCAKE